MKKKLLVLLLGFAFAGHLLKAQSADDILNLLVNQKVISQGTADSLRSDAAIKAHDSKTKQKSYIFLSGWGMTLNGYTQIRYQSFQEQGRADFMDLRRVRLDLKGNITRHWDYRLQMDFTGIPKILDLIIGFKPTNWFHIQAGQFKIPFSLENLTPSDKMEFIDRAQAVEALVARPRDVIGNQNGRDIGLQMNGSLFKVNHRYLMEYFIAAFDGQGINTLDLNEMKDISGRVLFHPIKGLDIAGAYYAGYDVINSKNTVRNRTGIEAAYSIKDFAFKAEYLHGIDRPNDAAVSTQREGYYAQASYFFLNHHLQACLKYDYYDPNTSVPNYDGNSSTANDASTYYILGVNAFFNEYTKLYVNYSYRRAFDSQSHEINKDLISAQIQIGF